MPVDGDEQQPPVPLQIDGGDDDASVTATKPDDCVTDEPCDRFVNVDTQLYPVLSWRATRIRCLSGPSMESASGNGRPMLQISS